MCEKRPFRSAPQAARSPHLLKSVTLTLEKTAEYTEQEMNRKLADWLGNIGTSLRLDYAELRRYLVNEEYLGRTKDGSRYWVAMSSRNQIPFDPNIEATDVCRLVQEARTEIQARKRTYLRA